MRTSDVIARIKAQCPAFLFVGHALTSNLRTDLPAALVTPRRVVADEPDVIGRPWQITSVIWSIAIILPRAQDEGTDVGTDLLEDCRDQLRAALLGWGDEGGSIGPLQYAGGELDKYAEQTACWREDWLQQNEIR